MERNNKEKEENKIEEENKSCLTCKLIGVSTFTGIGLYTSYLLINTPKLNKTNRIFYSIFSLSAFTIAIIRGLDKN